MALLLGACERSAPPASSQSPLASSQPASASSQTAPASWQPLPGAELPPATVTALEAARQSRPNNEEIRTRHRRDDGSPKYTNRLLLESSPYLRQHANNPVNWYPWGDEAFDTARRLGRPVLLSIGYSTCHWCHVMEEESFEDEEIASLLNERYVAIKVDREQRPDLDSIYMTAVQAITGRGGWPMTVWLTPDREPFHGGTYFPPRDGARGGMPGFLTVLTKVADAYRSDPGGASAKAAELAATIRTALASGKHGASASANLDDALEAALAASRRRFDDEHGGTRGAPKFPSALPLRALLRHHRRSGNAEALGIVTATLDGMAAGGIRDHLAGGFHRYSVDASWLVPHFEKMLYDNALLAMLYVEAWQATGREEFATVAKEIFSWVERDMTAPEGGFYSATDADSPASDGKREEGRFFTWSPAETAAVLGETESPLFNAAYGVTSSGQVDGRSVLHVAATPDGLARAFSTTVDEVRERLARSRAGLLDARKRRPPPLRDGKILTSWNGLMISATARASVAFGEDRLRSMGARAADFVLGEFARSGRLAHSIVGDTRQPEAFLDDYADLEAGLLDLYEAGDGDARLAQAIALDAVVENEFEDPAGGFFMAPAGRGDLLIREKSIDDGAEPSGSSIAIGNLLRLAELTGNLRFRKRADRALAGLADRFASNPLSVADALLAADFASDSPKAIVFVTDGDRETLEPFLRVLGAAFVPNRVVVAVTPTSEASRRLPLAEGKVTQSGKPTAYVCEARVCDLPTTDAAVLAAQLRRSRPLAASAH